MKEFLIKGLEMIGIDYSRRQLDTLLDFYNELSAWNRRAGFVKADGEDLVIRHFFDSLAGVPLLEKMDFKTAADAGSGAGFPGIPLSIFFPDRNFTLIERSAKKTAFLNNCRILFALDNVSVAESELENISGVFDMVTFRAFRNFNEYYLHLFRILSDKGFLFAYKGRRGEIDSEMESAGIKDYSVQQVHVPFMTEERHIVTAGKAGIISLQILY
jgi:16S rRNA (guanine527-N7)-methyltransferase